MSCSLLLCLTTLFQAIPRRPNMSRLTITVTLLLISYHVFTSVFTEAFLTFSSRAADVRPQQKLHVSTTSDDAKLDVLIDDVPPCLYKAHDNRWKQRVELKSLRIGQRLIGVAINGTELLEAKTGPKLFFECGVGRVDSKGQWQMVSGMMRLGNDKGYKMKLSIAKKKSKKFEYKPVDLFVSKIRLDHGALEVSSNAPNNLGNEPALISASTLKLGDELIGTVVEVRPYGCIVHVGANRKGLLHIKMIAQLYGTYIAKEQGIIDAGLEKGARIRVSVRSNIRKRLLLDFPVDVKESADIPSDTTSNDSGNANFLSDEEASEWASFATQAAAGTKASTKEAESGTHFIYENDDDDDDDEDRLIENAFGLGSY